MNEEGILWLVGIVAPAALWYLMDHFLPEPLLRIAKGLFIAWGIFVLILVEMSVAHEGFSHL